jgi:hypothetical protein
MQEYPNSFLAGLEVLSSSDGSLLESSLANLSMVLGRETLSPTKNGAG